MRDCTKFLMLYPTRILITPQLISKSDFTWEDLIPTPLPPNPSIIAPPEIETAQTPLPLPQSKCWRINWTRWLTCRLVAPPWFPAVCRCRQPPGVRECWCPQAETPSPLPGQQGSKKKSIIILLTSANSYVYYVAGWSIIVNTLSQLGYQKSFQEAYV